MNFAGIGEAKGGEALRDYELVLVISPEIGEDNFPAVLDKVNTLITARSGSVVDTKHWGKRRLAYPIGRFREANYVLIELNMAPGQTRELETNLRISEEILRHLLIRLEGVVRKEPEPVEAVTS